MSSDIVIVIFCPAAETGTLRNTTYSSPSIHWVKLQPAELAVFAVVTDHWPVKGFWAFGEIPKTQL